MPSSKFHAEQDVTSLYDLPYRLIKSRWLVGTDDLFTVETIHSSRVSKFWFFFEILDLMTI